jgi:hypothetical protein
LIYSFNLNFFFGWLAVYAVFKLKFFNIGRRSRIHRRIDGFGTSRDLFFSLAEPRRYGFSGRKIGLSERHHHASSAGLDMEGLQHGTAGVKFGFVGRCEHSCLPMLSYKF